ncbi:MAG: hypothetical protein WDW38_006661 [Sanguina aurantia]
MHGVRGRRRHHSLRTHVLRPLSSSLDAAERHLSAMPCTHGHLHPPATSGGEYVQDEEHASDDLAHHEQADQEPGRDDHNSAVRIGCGVEAALSGTDTDSGTDGPRPC